MVVTAVAACGRDGSGNAIPAGSRAAPAVYAVLPPGTYRARAHAQAMDYHDQTAVVNGQLRITDTTQGLDGYKAHFREAGATYDAYYGTVLSRNDSVRIGLFCDACRVQAALGPVSRTTTWSSLYRARALGGDRFELRQLLDGDDQPVRRPTVDTLVRVGG